MSDINLSSFPKNELEALTMLYLQNQVLSGLTPEELFDKYREVYNQMYARYKEMRSNQRCSTWTY